MSRKNRRSLNAPIVAARKTENLRDRMPVARRERHYDERRQFDLPPSKLEMPDDFARNYPEEYSRVDGQPAHIVHELPPRNRNNVRVRESNLQESLHAYFQDSPELVSECVRRACRRRVLFALQRTRKGSGIGKKHKWTEMSRVRCV